MNRSMLWVGAVLLSGCVFVDSQDIPAGNDTPNNRTNNVTNNVFNNLNNLNNVLNNVLNNIPNNGTACVPETDQQLCENDGKDCSDYTVTDRCGTSRTVACGTCAQGVGCGESIPNVCGCPCTIGGECYARVANPDNPCEQCNPEASPTSWTTRPSGAPCNTGNLCVSNETCDANGECVGPMKACDEEGPCRAGTCDPGSGECTYTDKSDTTQCGDDGLSCTQDLCVSGVCHTLATNTCVIDGKCYNTGALKDPTDCSMSCNPRNDPYDWSPAQSNTQCDPDPDSCSTGVCSNDGRCLTTNGAPGLNPKDGSQCVQNNCRGICYMGTCSNMISSGMSDQCNDNGTCYEIAEIRPSNPCQWCNTTQNQVGYVSWINVPNGTACTDGNTVGFCQGGSCQP